MKNVALTTLLCFSAICAHALDEPAPPVPNAALQYWQAFSMMTPNITGAKGLTGEAINKGAHAPAEARKELLVLMHDPLRLLHRGAQMRFCDWGIDVTLDGPGTLMPHLSKARTLARAGCAAAADAFENQQHEKGVGILFDALALGHHTGRDGVLICELVEISIENMAVEALAERLPRLPKPLLASLEAKFDALPPGATIAESIHAESYFIDYAEREAKKATIAAKLASAARDLFGGKDDNIENEIFAHPERYAALFPECHAYYKELEAVMALPYAQFAAAETALREKYKSNVLIRVLTPSFQRTRQTLEAKICQRLLLSAAIHIILDGKTDAANTTDPYAATPAPFTYKAVPGGFELSSKLMHNEKPVTLHCAPYIEPNAEPVKPPKPPKPEEKGDF